MPFTPSERLAWNTSFAATEQALADDRLSQRQFNAIISLAQTPEALDRMRASAEAKHAQLNPITIKN